MLSRDFKLCGHYLVIYVYECVECVCVCMLTEYYNM